MLYWWATFLNLFLKIRMLAPFVFKSKMWQVLRMSCRFEVLKHFNTSFSTEFCNAVLIGYGLTLCPCGFCVYFVYTLLGNLFSSGFECSKGGQRYPTNKWSLIQRINHYPADGVVCFANAYPLDSDISVGECYPALEQPEPDILSAILSVRAQFCPIRMSLFFTLNFVFLH